MTDSLLTNPMLVAPLALAAGVGGSTAYHGVGEELTNCQPLIEHALNHQRLELKTEQIIIRFNELEGK